MGVQDLTLQEIPQQPKGTLCSLQSRVSVPSSALPAGTGPFMLTDTKEVVPQGKAPSKQLSQDTVTREAQAPQQSSSGYETASILTCQGGASGNSILMQQGRATKENEANSKVWSEYAADGADGLGSLRAGSSARRRRRRTVRREGVTDNDGRRSTGR